jgi:spermidine/putrescine transport system permease protein
MLRFVRLSYLFFIYAFLYIPIILLAVYSFNQSKYSITWVGFTFDWYRELFSNRALIEASFNSFIVASLSATIAAIIGTLIALWLYAEKSRSNKYMYFLIYTLVMSPDIVMAISLLILFVVLHIKLGFLTLLISHITFELPFVVITVLSRLKLFNKGIIEAARDLGASDYHVFRKILLPLMMPAIISSWLLSFTLSLDDVVISFFVTGPGFEILPLKIYSLARLGIKPEINALCFILFVISLVLATISQITLRRKV